MVDGENNNTRENYLQKKSIKELEIGKAGIYMNHYENGCQRVAQITQSKISLCRDIHCPMPRDIVESPCCRVYIPIAERVVVHWGIGALGTLILGSSRKQY